MTGRVLLYGANGFNGRKIAERLADLGERLVLGGRGGAEVGLLAEQLGLPMRVFRLDDDEAMDRALADVALVVHAAGPYRDTAAPMIAACLRAGADYIDLTGEWPIFAAAMARNAAARSADVMLMPGAGVAITVTDCLLAMAAEAAPAAVKLRLAISRPHQMSRGSVRTMLALADRHVLTRRDGRIHRTPAGGLTRDFDFGEGRRRAVAFSWPDVLTAQFTTGVASIEAYTEQYWGGAIASRVAGAASPLALSRTAQRIADRWPERPSGESLEKSGYRIVAEAEDRWRRTTALRLRIADGYSTTAAAVDATVRRVLGGERRAGFQTPGKLFGSRFVLGLGPVSLDPVAA